MKIFFSAIIIFSIVRVEGRSKLEEVIKKYENKYGLVFDAWMVLSQHYIADTHKEEQLQQVDLAKKIFQLGIDINNYGSVPTSAKTKIISPLSIASVLGELLLGASGRTSDEISHAFGIEKSGNLQQDPHSIHLEFGHLLSEVDKSGYQSRTLRRRNIHGVSTKKQITVANGIFIQNGITLRADYQTKAKRIYKSEISTLDFRQASGSQARDYINNWVEKKTHGKIHQIIGEEIPQDRKMIIVNALYFRSMWENPFIKGGTKRGNFYPDGIFAKPISNVPMMTVADVFPYYESQDYGCRIIGLPYKGNDAVMYVILPNDSSRTTLQDFQSRVDADTIEDWIRRLEMKSMLVSLPRMHLKSSVNLKEALKANGMHSLFDAQECDLSSMVAKDSLESASHDGRDAYVHHINPRDESDSRGRTMHSGSAGRRTMQNTRAPVKSAEQLKAEDLFVEDIFHRIDLNVNEDGAEGAAVTATVLSRNDYEDDFEVNAPFMLIIQHTKTKLPIFFGSVFDPRS